ncbi:hypothetical protein CBER1_02997 [Cercospora berteroae]|uniref:Uncharacterized protein n=1 Tax=Cercospora berteroae TaxID=357750 RepID=A0A2S6C2N3_9PEZI|nr:hypothetical protein CBER1_02997 [Cercospora berteroae]
MKHRDIIDRGLRGVCSALSLSTSVKPRTARSLDSSALSLDTGFVHVGADIESSPTTTMGKSNKFDYSNRPNSGEKLGGIIGRDVEKEVDKVAKDVEKQVVKARQSSIGSNGSSLNYSAISEDVVHYLDIKAPAKQLGDEGACAMATRMATALTKQVTGASVLLEDLNISDNGITTATLAQLAPVIKAAHLTLKTLNLSNNNIRVETDQQADEWELFLRSFKDCFKLRRLDLSGNINLGARAMEILAKVHCHEPRIDPVLVGGGASVRSLNMEEDHETAGTPTSAAFSDAMAKGGFVKRRCGLRGIPYFTLTNVGLTDAGALWLSYVLEDHYYPIQLIDAINAAPASSGIRTYAQDSASTGLDWDAQETALGKDGLLLLKKTEIFRKQVMLDDGSTLEYSLEDSKSVLRASAGHRRASVRSTTAADEGEHGFSEIESLRMKLQRHIIANSGVSQVELWRAGLRIISSSTVLNRYRIHRGTYYKSHTGCKTSHSGAPQLNGEHEPPESSRNGNHSARQGTYAQTLTVHTGAVPGEPEFAITDVTNIPTTPKMIFKPHRKGAFSEGSDLPAVTQKMDGLVVRDGNPERFVRWQEDMIERKGGMMAFRDSTVPTQLPQSVLELIVASTVNKHALGLFTQEQFRAACAWSRDRSTLEMRESWERLANSSRVLSLLEHSGCVAYQAD